MPTLPTQRRGRIASSAVWFGSARDRALEVQLTLGGKGKHRAPSIPDLIIAATAELAGLTVLHVNKDFDLIADITDQPVIRLRVPIE